VTVDQLNTQCAEFMNECLQIMADKGHEYAPDGVAFADVNDTAVIIGIPDDGDRVLYAHMRKHLKALEYFMCHRHLRSETLRSRLHDIVNFSCMIAVWHQVQIDKQERDKHLATQRLNQISDAGYFPTLGDA
jgi:hypothetical protein